MIRPKPRLQTLRPRVSTLRPTIRQTPAQSQRLTGRPWRRLRDEVLQGNPLCVECERVGRVELAVEVDHRVALAIGGSNDRTNLQPLCRACHVAKTQRDIAIAASGGRP